MEILTHYYNLAVESYGVWGLALVGAVLVFFAIQMRYYLGLFRRLPSFKMGTWGTEERSASISVVVVMGDDYLWVDNTLPLLMGQDHPLYEVIVVYVGSNNEFAERLEVIGEAESKFRVSRVKQHPLFPISTKMAINIGVKAARYDNVVVTTPDTHPVSERWLSLMAKGFQRGEIVIGYCGIEPARGLADKIIRSSRLFSSMLYLTSAILRRPYRGTIHNLGFSRELYFEHKGFGHLNLNLGEDDLFMQQLLTADNYSVVMHPRATVRQMRWGGLGWWFHECRLRNHSFPFYPFRARFFICFEGVSRLLFFGGVAAMAVLLPFEMQVAAAGLFVLRLITVLIQVGRLAKRLGERRLVPFYFINDIFEPLTDIFVAFTRRIKPIREVWR